MPLTIKALKDGVQFLPKGSGEVVVSKKGEEYECADDTALLLVQGDSFAPVDWEKENPPPPESKDPLENAFSEGWMARESASAAIDDAIDGITPKEAQGDYYAAARDGADDAVHKGEPDEERMKTDFCYSVGYAEATDILAHQKAEAKAAKKKADADAAAKNAKKAKDKADKNAKDGK